jgi:hypothetical protein
MDLTGNRQKALIVFNQIASMDKPESEKAELYKALYQIINSGYNSLPALLPAKVNQEQTQHLFLEDNQDCEIDEEIEVNSTSTKSKRENEEDGFQSQAKRVNLEVQEDMLCQRFVDIPPKQSSIVVRNENPGVRATYQVPRVPPKKESNTMQQAKKNVHHNKPKN